MEGTLIVVGTGLRLGHLTLESKSAIEDCKKVLYLISDPITASYIKTLNSNVEDLYRFYDEGKDRLTIYNELIDYCLKTLLEFKDVCVAFYGHPGIYTYPSHKIIEKARSLGFNASMYSGISTEDMFFTDLGVDPGATGVQSFEVNQLLDLDIKYDPRCYLILWQIGIIGKSDYSQQPFIKENLTLLKDKLLTVYTEDQEIIFYMASNHKMFDSTILKTKLKFIDTTEFNPVSTLIIPPRVN